MYDTIAAIFLAPVPLRGDFFQFITEYFFCFFPSHLFSSPFFSLLSIVVTQIRGHIAGSSPPLPTTVRALHFYREKISARCSLVDSRRIVLTHARRSQQLIIFSFFFLQINSKSLHGGIRTHGPNTNSIRGLPLDHPGGNSLIR